jgi:hypothetical protein
MVANLPLQGTPLQHCLKDSKTPEASPYPFVNLQEVTPGRWGQGLTAAKMKECIWANTEFVANFEFLAWTDSQHVRHI